MNRRLSLRELLSRRQERAFLASVGFFAAFAVTRAITHALHAEHAGTAGGIIVGGLHVHHLVFGITILLFVGLLWLLRVGTGTQGHFASRLTAILFGVGAALTLDEFALWLTLQDVYWARQGRDSVDAVIFFGAVLSVLAWGSPLLLAIAGTRDPRPQDSERDGHQR